MKHISFTLPQSKAITRIRHFFDLWSLPAAIDEINTIFRKAASDKAWRPPNPYNAMQQCEQLWKLSKAAYALVKNYNDDLANKIIAKPGANGPDLALEENYKSKGRWATAFSDFPRHLTAKEYRYPVKALNNFCGYSTKFYWKQFYKKLAQCALSSTSLTDYEKAAKLMQAKEQVFKLVEGCHLINVRVGKMRIVVGEEVMNDE